MIPGFHGLIARAMSQYSRMSLSIELSGQDAPMPLLSREILRDISD
jgi:isopentenyl diphosphate isomerase/L-lactate dehydrogenase-like FMN-dependent dehydrogenase